MNSIGIWWENPSGRGNPKIHLDVNLWLTSEKEDNYIEFGLKLEEFSVINKIYIFLPYVVQKDTILDKTDDLIKSTELTNALFNEILTIANNGSKYNLATYANGDSFYFYDINIDNDVEVEEFMKDGKAVGTIIGINVESFNGTPTKDVLYSRIRINKLENIYKTTFINYMFLDGFSEEHSTVEFNLNTIRKLPNDIVQKIGADIKIKSLNMFLMTDTFSDIVLKTNDIHASRILENHIWDDYLGNRSIDKVIAYHWKEKPEDVFFDYNLFIKTTLIKRSKMMLVKVVIAILILGILADVLGSLISNSNEDKTQNQAICCQKDKDSTAKQENEENATIEQENEKDVTKSVRKDRNATT